MKERAQCCSNIKVTGGDLPCGASVRLTVTQFTDSQTTRDPCGSLLLPLFFPPTCQTQICLKMFFFFITAHWIDWTSLVAPFEKSRLICYLSIISLSSVVVSLTSDMIADCSVGHQLLFLPPLLNLRMCQHYVTSTFTDSIPTVFILCASALIHPNSVILLLLVFPFRVDTLLTHKWVRHLSPLSSSPL